MMCIAKRVTSDKFVELNNIKRRKEADNFKILNILCPFVSMTSSAQVRASVLFTHTLNVPSKWTFRLCGTNMLFESCLPIKCLKVCANNTKHTPVLHLPRK